MILHPNLTVLPGAGQSPLYGRARRLAPVRHAHGYYARDNAAYLNGTTSLPTVKIPGMDAGERYREERGRFRRSRPASEDSGTRDSRGISPPTRC
jgi:hypothetical protein